MVYPSRESPVRLHGLLLPKLLSIALLDNYSLFGDRRSIMGVSPLPAIRGRFAPAAT